MRVHSVHNGSADGSRHRQQLADSSPYEVRALDKHAGTTMAKLLRNDQIRSVVASVPNGIVDLNHSSTSDCSLW
ncbi:hypothetical protein GCM10009103_55030 [Pseudomonas koreensis]|nr:hypothetical protein GCM10009103_55030 [Pseudomonas koreensis]